MDAHTELSKMKITTAFCLLYLAFAALRPCHGEELFPLVQSPPEVSVKTGKRTVVIPLTRMPNGHGFPDMPLAFLGTSPLRFLMVCGNDTCLWSGKTLGDAALVGNVFAPGPKGSVDNNYAGISSTYHDRARKRIIAFYHAEDSEGMDRLEVNGVQGFYGRICVAESPENTVSFTKLGPAITSDTPKRIRPWETDGGPKDAWLSQGVGDPYVFIDKEQRHLLCIYGEWSNRFRENRGVQLNLARAPIASAGLPGTWMKCYRGKFDEPGIGGHETSVLSARPHGDAISAHVQYVPDWKRYVMVFSLNVYSEVERPDTLKHSGVYVSTSTDAIDWSKPVLAETILTMFVNGQECMMHPFMMVKSATPQKLIGHLMYRYSSKWPTDQGCLCAAPIQISLLPSSLAAGERRQRDPPKRNDVPQAFVFNGEATIRTPIKRQFPITVEMWIKPEHQDKDVFVVGSSSLTHQGIGVGLNKGFLRAQHLIGDFGCGEMVAAGQWHHVAGTFDNESSHLFLNGKQVAKGPGNKPVDDSPIFVIGDIGTLYSGHHFKGAIRSVRLSKGVRYTADFNPPATFEPDENAATGNTLLIYDASATYGDEVTDLSGNAAHGIRAGVSLAPDRD